MKKTYRKRFQKLSEQLTHPDLPSHARIKNSNTFSRNRKMPLKDMLLCCLAKKGMTTVLELRNFFKQKKGTDMKISTQGYLQQRKRLNPDVFSYLNDEYLADFYHSSETELWNGYLLLAIDGSKVEIPNSMENRRNFGTSSNQHSKQGQARALISGMYDILNGFYLDIQIAHICTSENELAKKNLDHLKMTGIDLPILAVFDRGYPSLEFIDHLETNGIHYLFRLSSNDYKAERENMRSSDEYVYLKHTHARLAKIQKKHPDRWEHMREKEVTRTRILNKELPSGTELVLMTDLPKNFTSDQIQELYYKRWEIEKKYHTLKNKMKFESVTGKASIYVYQDFYAQILVYNMMHDIHRSADQEVVKNEHMKKKRYPMHTNENIAIGLFKECMIKILLEENAEKRGRLLTRLQSEMEQYVLPIRNLPDHERKKNLTNKYKNNQKNSF